MSGRDPDQIWDEGAEEGERRLRRGTAALAATGVIGGVDVLAGIMALAIVSGAVATITEPPVAHAAGSLVFGFGFVLLVIGRSELFTENFLIPIAAVLQRRSRPAQVARLWSVTAVANIAGLLLGTFLLTREGVLPSDALKEAGVLADTFARRDVLAAALSGIAAGVVMTLFTWLTHAVELDISRIVIALIIGALLALPTLNHAIVGFGEMVFGVFAGTAKETGWDDVVTNLLVASAANVLGGLCFVTLARGVQVRGEPEG